MATWQHVMLSAILLAAGSSPAFAKRVAPAPQDIPKEFALAWQRHSGAELARLATRNVDFVNVGAIWLHGRAFETYHERVFKGRFRDSTIVPLEIDVRYIRADIAAVRWSWRLDGERDNDDRTGPARYGLMTLIVERGPSGWLISTAQNTNSGPPRREAEGLDMPIVVPRAPAN